MMCQAGPQDRLLVDRDEIAPYEEADKVAVTPQLPEAQSNQLRDGVMMVTNAPSHGVLRS